MGARGGGGRPCAKAKPPTCQAGGRGRGCFPKALETDPAGPVGDSGHDAGGLSGPHSVTSQSREGLALGLKQREAVYAGKKLARSSVREGRPGHQAENGGSRWTWGPGAPEGCGAAGARPPGGDGLGGGGGAVRKPDPRLPRQAGPGCPPLG